MVVIDEADVFFKDEKNLESLKDPVLKQIKRLPNLVQFLLFSATYPDSC